MNPADAVTPEYEQELADRLGAFDDALRAGVSAAPPAAGSVERRVQDCLRMLEDFWPRHPNNAPSGLRITLPGLTAGPGGVPAAVGRFRVVRELGRGGFGIVYLAVDPQLNREVAVKVPRAEALGSPELRRRFRQEALAAAALDHPNVVPVYETGEAGPLCWIVSAYCPGSNLADWLRARTDPVPVADAGGLVATLADAVQHAHDRGVLHRDLKPANVLLGIEDLRLKIEDSEPKNSGLRSSTFHLKSSIPKITDFGLAKVRDAGDATQTGTQLGTPAYMAPEQAAGAAVGPAADVYALGAVLYELLTGRTPFVAGSAVEMLLLARTEEPVPPGRLRHRLPRDLETVCLKCLEKEPGRRYASAGRLADDLRRFLAGRPITARPPGPAGRAWRLARRRPREAGLVAALGLVLVLGAGGVLWQWWRAERNAAQAGRDRDAAVQARQGEAAALDRHRIMRAYDEWQGDNAQAARDLLRDAAARRDTWEWRYVARLCNLGLVADDHPAAVLGAAFTADGRSLVSADRDGGVTVRDLAAGTADAFAVPADRPAELSGLAVAPDGRHLAVGTAGGVVRVWDFRGKRPVADWQAHPPGPAVRVAYDPTGRFLATAAGGAVKVWDPGTRAEARAYRFDGQALKLAWSPDGRHLAACANGFNFVRIWDVQTGAVTDIPTMRWMPTAVAFSPDGRRFAWVGMDGVVAVHEAAAGFPRVGTLSGLPGYQSCLAFSPDGLLIAAGGRNGPLKVYRVDTGQQAGTLHGHTSGVRDAAFSPDGARVATAGVDRRVVVWDFVDDQEAASPADFAPGRFHAAAFTPDGRGMVTAVRQFRLWDLDRLTATFSTRPLIGLSAAVRPDGAEFAGGDDGGTVRVYDPARGEVAARKMPGLPLAVRYADGGRLLVAGWANGVYAWDPHGKADPERVAGPLGRAAAKVGGAVAAFSPEGDGLVYADRGQPPAVWDVRAGRRTAALDAAPAAVTAVAFDRPGRRVAVGGGKGELHVHDAATGRVLGRLPGHPAEVTGVAFTPDGRRLASTAADGVVKLWDPDAGVEVLSLRGHATFDTALAFSPDGDRLVAGGWDGFLRVWTARDPRAEPPAARTDRRLTWHRAQAAEAVRARRWFAARHHLNQLEPTDRDRTAFRRDRATLLAETGDWAAAAADLDAAVAAPDCPMVGFFERAALYLRAGDRAGYARVCGDAVRRFGDRTEAGVVNDLAALCLMAPGSGVPAGETVRRAERGLAGATADAQRALYANTVGMALLRAGRPAEAVARLDESVRRHGRGGDAENWGPLAAAHAALGHPDQARAFLARAAAEADKARAGATLADGRKPNWRLAIELDLLHREAAAAVGPPP